MIITKAEARKRKMLHTMPKIYGFHLKNPDQEGVYHCKTCVVIQDSCGCDQDMECPDCRPRNKPSLI